METLIDRATSEVLMMPDWGINMDLSDRAGTAAEVARDVCKCLRKRLSHRNPKVLLLSITLLDTCFKNSGPVFHAAANARDAGLCAVLASLAEPSPVTDAEVRVAAAGLLQELSIAFGPQASTTPWKATYDALVSKGVQFPSIDPATVTVHPVPPPAAASPALQAARSAALSGGHVPHGQQHGAGMPPGLAAAGTSGGRQGGPWGAPPGVPQGYPLAGHPGFGQPVPMPMQGLYGQHYPAPHRQQHPRPGPAPDEPRGLAHMPLEQQLAAVDRSFEKLRADLHKVRGMVAQAAREGVEGHTGPTAPAWLDAVDFCTSCLPRLAVLIEVGISGVLDETLFEVLLAVNEACARVAAAGETDLKAADSGAIPAPGLNPEASSTGARPYPELQDLVAFDKPQAQAAQAANQQQQGPGEPVKQQAATGSDNMLGLFAAGAALGGAAALASSASVPGPMSFGPVPTPGTAAAGGMNGLFGDAPAAAKPATHIGLDDFAAPAPVAAQAVTLAPGAGAAGSSAELQDEIDDLLNA